MPERVFSSLMAEGEASLLADARQVDDCWNRIGTLGDQSCPRLPKHIRCLNCAVYSAAAISLLDRYALHRDDSAAGEAMADPRAEGEAADGCSTLVFRLGEEWLGLATRHLVEVAPLSPIHSLPHQRSPGVLGVVNVRGVLVACLSLPVLLGVDATTAGGTPEHRVTPRMLIVAGADGPMVAPVDEVAGIFAIDESLMEAIRLEPPAGAACCRGFVRWRGRGVRLIDAGELMQTMERSLA